MNACAHHVASRFGRAAFTLLLLPGVTRGDGPDAMLIRLAGDAAIEVVALDPQQPPAKSTRGLAVWSADGERERWRSWSKLGTWPPPSDFAEAAPVGLTAAVRGAGGGAASDDSAGFAEIVQLEQLSTDTLTRAAVLVSPRHNAELLQSQITFRRLPEGAGDNALPPRVATVYAAEGNREVLRVPFAAGRADVAWAEIQGLAAELAQGLSPGRYFVRLEQAAEQTEFTIADAAQRQRVWRRIDEFASLVGGRDEALRLQFAAAQLLQSKGRDGVPLYLTDAWLLLARAPDASLTPWLRSQRDQLLGWLERLARDPGAQSGQIVTGGTESATGIAVIDEARQLLAAGRWDEAADLLDTRLGESREPLDARTRGLAELYRAVILAEAGMGREREAAAAFERAVEQLREGQPADQYRVALNFGNFLLHQAQDRLHNLSFQMAAGVQQPLLSALRAWAAARVQYGRALDLARQIGDPNEVAATQLNFARLYALLADVVRTFNAAGSDAGELADMETAATDMADDYVAGLADGKSAGVTDRAVSAAAAELRAHLAFRRGELAACRQQAAAAHDGYVQTGRLAGIESVARLRGLVEQSAGDADAALRQFLISQSLAELLRERFPPDQVGLSRAGFFARRSYVYERTVELLIAAGRPAEALRYAELAKARAAQDFLAAGGLKARGQLAADGLPELLAAWPKDTAAVEYFLGGRQSWVFVVDPSGRVEATPLRDSRSQRIASQDLIQRVRLFLGRTENQASKMTQGILAGRGFDHSWQNDLDEIRRVLLPDAALAQLRGAKTVVLVPQHILHYFPFAALVTSPDAVKRSEFEMVQPRFLVDEPFSLIYAPSLLTWQLLNAQPRTPINLVTAVGVAEVPGAPPLPGVTQDLENIRTVFGKRVGKVYEADEARESGAKLALRQRGLLLLATHGFNEPDQPLESHLLFLPDEAEVTRAVDSPARPAADANDGHLSAREIFATRVRAEMVVMNACYSGLGDRSPLPGDDLFGLQRAFLQSGTRTVVSGLWDVYDGTAPQLMRDFFEGVAAGRPASAALSDSQRKFLQELRASKDPQPWLHPYFWSVFTVAGADGQEVAR